MRYALLIDNFASGRQKPIALWREFPTRILRISRTEQGPSIA